MNALLLDLRVLSFPSFPRKRESSDFKLEMRARQPTVYILASDRNGTLYIGVTSDLIQRIWQHRNDAVEGFSKKYRAHKLMYFEQHATDGRRHSSREADQEVESGVEAQVD